MRSVVAAVAVVSTIALSACGTLVAPGAPSSATTSASSGSHAPTTQQPTELVGSWRVTDAAGAEPGAVLRIGIDLILFQSCGYLMGSWRASSSGLFAGSLDGGKAACFPQQPTPSATPAWLAAASAYDVTSDGITLLARDGSVVAHLLPGGTPTAGSDILTSEAEPPVLDDRLRAALADPLPLPTSYTPATREQLLGSWVTVLPAPSGDWRHETPGAAFESDGSYHATDGCNGLAGRWVADDTGRFIATGGASTAVGCDNVLVPEWVMQSSWAAIDDGVLVLVGVDGKETCRLRRP